MHVRGILHVLGHTDMHMRTARLVRATESVATRPLPQKAWPRSLVPAESSLVCSRQCRCLLLTSSVDFLLFTALYTKCPYYLVLSRHSVLIVHYFIIILCKMSLLSVLYNIIEPVYLALRCKVYGNIFEPPGSGVSRLFTRPNTLVCAP